MDLAPFCFSEEGLGFHVKPSTGALYVFSTNSVTTVIKQMLGKSNKYCYESGTQLLPTPLSFKPQLSWGTSTLSVL